MSRKGKANAFVHLVEALPEVYQPIFGHPEFSTNTSRACEDRLEHIVRIYSALAALLQRPLRVLDLGSAQGFFSFNLAELGASVHGVDYIDANIAVCNELASEHKNLNTSFQVGHIEDVLRQLAPDQYDMVLGLSVFHHIVHEKGAQAVALMLDDLASKVACSVFELALAGEPLYWAAAQTLPPRELLSGFAFVHELAQHGTHLSKIQRPLYFASNRFWFLGGQAGAFSEYQSAS
ncbi:MAG: class I SAM-dependent methyltransferase, partial [Alphaproteobacteria bacterium]|nr:class I SAM-dependent methyltransferase [Alphaproteobacteria bacterium]